MPGRVRLDLTLPADSLFPGDRGARPGQVAERADRGGRHERPAYQAVGAELGEPGRVRDVGLASREVLDVPGVDQQHLERGVLQQVVEGFPVVRGRLHHHTGDGLVHQVVAQLEDLAGHRAPGRDRLLGCAAARPGDAHADLGVLLRDVQARAAGVHDVHHMPPTQRHGVRRGEGWGDRSLTHGLEGTNPRFPWKPSATMLTYRLTGTTEHIGVDHDEHHHDRPRPAMTATARKRRIFAHHGAPRRRRRDADLRFRLSAGFPVRKWSAAVRTGWLVAHIVGVGVPAECQLRSADYCPRP